MRKVCLVAMLLLVAALASSSMVFAAESGYANVVTVSPTGADFTSVSAAINSITDASSTNRYVVKVYPGTYTGHVVCKQYVDIVGASRGSVILTDNGSYQGQGNWADYCTLVIAPNMNVSNMTIKATASNGVAVWGEGDDTIITNATIEGGGTSVLVSGPMNCDREADICRWTTLRDCSLIGGTEGASLWDSVLCQNCIFTVTTSSATSGVWGATINGNTIIRDSHVNILVTGSATSYMEIGGIVNTDAAVPTRIERTSVNVRVQNEAVGCTVYGIKNGWEGAYVGGVMDIDHCSISVQNSGTGPTYDLVNDWWQPEYGVGDFTRVFATKYRADHVSGHIEVPNEGNKVVNDLVVTGNLIVNGETFVILPDKDRARSLPIFVSGTTMGMRKLMGDPTATPVVGYSFPDNVTLTKLTLIGAIGNGNFPEPEANLYLYKNGQVVSQFMLVYGVGGTGEQSMYAQSINIPLTPEDRISYILQGVSQITDASIILDYNVN